MKPDQKQEVFVLIFVFTMVIAGIILSRIDLQLFLQRYVPEDGLIEWLTIVGLLSGAAMALYNAYVFYKWKGINYSFFTLLVGILLILVAGEEISWGQRIFNTESGDFFLKHNSQQETNIHNMVFGGVRINRVVFSLALTICVSVYIIIIPYLYFKKEKIRHIIDSYGILLPKVYQTISFIVLFLIIELIPDGKKYELTEFGYSFLFALIQFYPLNSHIFPDKRRFFNALSINKKSCDRNVLS